jgi:ubiquinone/menaquinone biosynthesis C-methylase UbiE
MEERKQIEADFHDQRSRDRKEQSTREFEKKYPNKTFYVVTREHRERTKEWISNNCVAGKVVLDFCCGEGGGAIRMAQVGAKVFGVDISEESLESGRAACAKYENQPEFIAMDAENLKFSDNYFDAIYAAGCFHHLDLDKTYAELHRVLKPGGTIMCNEALAHNPVFHYYRKRTPHLRTPWEVPHILKVPDIMRAKKYFDKIDIQYHYLTILCAVPLRRTFLFEPAMALLGLIDKVILSIPGIRRLAWQCTFVMSQPRK